MSELGERKADEPDPNPTSEAPTGRCWHPLSLEDLQRESEAARQIDARLKARRAARAGWLQAFNQLTWSRAFAIAAVAIACAVALRWLRQS